MVVLVVLSLAVAAIFALGLLTALARGPGRGKARIDAAEDRPVPHTAPLVSVCVPARNEEANLDACLSSLRASSWPNFEIIVVDDRSTDQTGEILARHAKEDPRIVALSGAEPEPGWLGKPNALRQAIARARGAWILTTDADTVHAKSALVNVMAYAAANGIASVSLLAKIVCESFWAKLLAPQLGALLFVGRSPKRINDPEDRAVFGSGVWFLVRRDAYDAAGGIAAVKDQLDDDVAFARALKATGLGYHFVEGEALVSTKFYSTLGEFFAGFGKNMWSTLEGRTSKLVKLTLVLWVMSLVPITTAIVSAAALAAGTVSPALGAIGVAQYLAVLAMQMLIRAKNGFPAWMALLAPIGGMIAWTIIASSAYRGLTGRTVSWKGREYRAR